MNKMEYKNYRKVIINEYESGFVTSGELREALFHLTGIYREANNITLSGSRSEPFIHEVIKGKNNNEGSKLSKEEDF